MHDLLRDRLHREGYLTPAGVQGLYGTDGRFERLVAAVGSIVSGMAAEAGATVLRFPPVIAAGELERVGYVRSFPHLAAAVSVVDDEAYDARMVSAHLYRGRSWADVLRPAGIAPCPSACYPIYPGLAGRTVTGDLRYDVAGHCFRNEPSDDPFRMQSFRMHEIVCVGSRATVDAFLTQAHDMAGALFARLGVDVSRVAASDPFFGPGGRVLSREQRERELKQEYVFRTAEATVALASVNDHENHFARPYDIRLADHEPAASACVGFGLERIVLAAFAGHGPDPAAWPGPVRRGFEVSALPHAPAERRGIA